MQNTEPFMQLTLRAGTMWVSGPASGRVGQAPLAVDGHEQDYLQIGIGMGIGSKFATTATVSARSFTSNVGTVSRYRRRSRNC